MEPGDGLHPGGRWVRPLLREAGGVAGDYRKK